MSSFTNQISVYTVTKSSYQLSDTKWMKALNSMSPVFRFYTPWKHFQGYGLKAGYWMMMMMMMNCFCGIVDPRKAFSLLSSQDNCQRSSPSRIKKMWHKYLHGMHGSDHRDTLWEIFRYVLLELRLIGFTNAKIMCESTCFFHNYEWDWEALWDLVRFLQFQKMWKTAMGEC